MLRLVWNADPHGDKHGIVNWLVNFFVYGSGGGQTSYIFGARKVLTYRLSHNFTVDRYHKTLGAVGAYLDKTETGLADRQKDQKNHIHDITWIPIGESDKFVNMILPIMFSLSLLAYDLVIVYKFKIASTALGASKDLDGNVNLDPSHKGMLMITLLEVFEEGMIQLMELVERFLCLKDNAKNAANGMKERVDNLETTLGKVEKTANAAATAIVVSDLKQDLTQLKASVDTLTDELKQTKVALVNAIYDFDSIIYQDSTG